MGNRVRNPPRLVGRIPLPFLSSSCISLNPTPRLGARGSEDMALKASKCKIESLNPPSLLCNPSYLHLKGSIDHKRTEPNDGLSTRFGESRKRRRTNHEGLPSGRWRRGWWFDSSHVEEEGRRGRSPTSTRPRLHPHPMRGVSLPWEEENNQKRRKKVMARRRPSCFL